MDLTHRFTVPTSVEETWSHFQDVASVAECFPGATVSSVDGDTFAGSVKVKLGPIALVYNGSGTFVEKDESAHRFVVEAKGKDKRGNGTAGAHVTLTMTESAGGSATGPGTDVEVVTDLAITGKPAQFGRGVMQDVSDKLLGQFVACLEQRLSGPTEGTGVPVEAPAAAVTADLTGMDGATDVAGAVAPSPAGHPEAGTPGAAPQAVLGQPESPDLESPAAMSQPATPQHAAPRPAPPADDSLDLGAAVLPVLARAYWKQGAGLLAVLLLLVWWRRRS